MFFISGCIVISVSEFVELINTTRSKKRRTQGGVLNDNSLPDSPLNELSERYFEESYQPCCSQIL